MNADVMVIVQHLSRYLRSHPEACDTSEGIARWWLGADAATPLTSVESALGWMSQRGLVASVRAADGRVRFRRAGGSELDMLLDVVAADPQAVLGPVSPIRPDGGVH
jgi:hypothetical protein